MKILFLSSVREKEDQLNDYMHDIVLHGLRKIYGESVIDYPGAWYMYRDEVKQRNFNINNLWGKGFTLYNLLSNFQQIDRTEIKKKIKKNYFDFIVFGSIHRTPFLFEESINSKSKIIFIDGNDHHCVNKKIIHKGVYFKRELISQNIKNIYPINFAIPKEKIVDKINFNPQNVLAPLIPGKKSTYLYQNEKDYYNIYQNSIFALTYKKTGWDTLRHYEILMNGCIPLFLDINNCPEKILLSLPKKKLLDIFNTYSWILNYFFPTMVYKRKYLNVKKFLLYFHFLFKEKFNGHSFARKYPEIIEVKRDLIRYTKEKLTTEKVAYNLIKDTSRYYN